MSEIKWERDASTGIDKQIVEDYTTSSELPGATIIPSHRGLHGKQAGRDKRGPIPMIVDPDRLDGGIIVTPDMLNNKQAVADASVGDPSAAFASLANTTEDDIVATRKKATKPKAKPVKAAAIPAVPAVEVPPAKVAADAAIEERVPESIDMGAVVHDVAAELLPAIQAMITNAMPVVPTEEPDPYIGPTEDAIEKRDAIAPVVVDDAPEAQPPRIQVILTDPSGSDMSLRYHHVIETTKDVVAFVYDTNFIHGDRVYPKANLGEPYTVEVLKGDDCQTTFTALYMGLRFNFKNYEFQVLLKTPIPQDPAPQGEAPRPDQY